MITGFYQDSQITITNWIVYVIQRIFIQHTDKNYQGINTKFRFIKKVYLKIRQQKNHS